MDSDNEIFITQNTFSVPDDSLDSIIVGEAAENILNVGDKTLDNLETIAEPACSSIPIKEKYQPQFSDISDDEFVSSCEAIEKQCSSRFGTKPLNEKQVAACSRKRYVNLVFDFQCILTKYLKLFFCYILQF